MGRHDVLVAAGSNAGLRAGAPYLVQTCWSIHEKKSCRFFSFRFHCTYGLSIFSSIAFVFCFPSLLVPFLYPSLALSSFFFLFPFPFSFFSKFVLILYLVVSSTHTSVNPVFHVVIYRWDHGVFYLINYFFRPNLPVNAR